MAGIVGIALAVAASIAEEPAKTPDQSRIEFQWGVKIPLRDGVHLNATLYTPKEQKGPAPCVFTLTPYIGQSYHERGVYFAARGFPYLTVDVRGRGNSEGVFKPFLQEAHDGYDVVEWLARQPYCNGKVAMWGGSYAGYDQWATAKELPPHLATIVPVASARPAVDFPMLNNMPYPYLLQWLTYTSGKASQAAIFGDNDFWNAKARAWFESGRPFREYDRIVGNPSPDFQEWISHPEPDAYWDSYAPTREQFASMQFPILTITASYDGDQPGAMAFYRDFFAYASAPAKARHYLVIGPWDHAGTRTPRAEVGGLKFGPASLVDLPKLHADWYAWTMQDGPKPQFLKKAVAYYVMGAEQWRYADSLDGVTAEARPFYFDSAQNAVDVFSAGSLTAKPAKRSSPDEYSYDPRDRSQAALQASVDSSSLVDQQLVIASGGKQLVYHTAPFDKDVELSGFFKLSAWIAIDQPDTDFLVSVYEIGRDGSSIYLSGDVLRARYREGLRTPKLVKTPAPLRYDFGRFTFVSRLIKQGSRLRVVIGPANSIYNQKNYNAGGVVSDESIEDARTVKVRLYHDAAHPSALYVPIGQPQTP
jgi:putative CocE/NonD family hydrolase